MSRPTNLAALVLGTAIALSALGIDMAIESFHEEKSASKIVSYADPIPGAGFGTGGRLLGLDNNHDGTIDEIRYKYTAYFGKGFAVPAEKVYTLKDKEFSKFYKILKEGGKK